MYQYYAFVHIPFRFFTESQIKLFHILLKKRKKYMHKIIFI